MPPRRHEGIYQSGPKKGKLKPGYRYTGDKDAAGKPKIAKSTADNKSQKAKQKAGETRVSGKHMRQGQQARQSKQATSQLTPERGTGGTLKHSTIPRAQHKLPSPGSRFPSSTTHGESGSNRIQDIQKVLSEYCPGIMLEFTSVYSKSVVLNSHILNLNLLNNEGEVIHEAEIVFSKKKNDKDTCDIPKMYTPDSHQRKGAQWIMMICIIALGNLAMTREMHQKNPLISSTKEITYEIWADHEATIKIFEKIGFKVKQGETDIYCLTKAPASVRETFQKYASIIKRKKLCHTKKAYKVASMLNSENLQYLSSDECKKLKRTIADLLSSIHQNEKNIVVPSNDKFFNEDWLMNTKSLLNTLHDNNNSFYDNQIMEIAMIIMQK